MLDYVIFAVILALIIAAVTAVVYFVTKGNGNRKSPFLIFTTVDIILAFIAGVAALFAYMADKNFGTFLLAVAYIFCWLPVAVVLGVIAVVFHFLSKKR